MRDLRKNWLSLRDRMAAGSRLCLLTDFDGTLVPIEEKPDLPRLPEPSRKRIEALIRNPRVTFGVVSGRALSDLMPRIGLPGIWYVGNHGFEMRNPRGEEVRFYEPEDLCRLEGVREELERHLQGIAGVWIEPKGPVVAVHYRKVDPSRLGDVERAFYRIAERNHRHVTVSSGIAVFELRLRGGPNKGRAVSLIRQELPAGCLVLYFGDDLTDRDAFRELKGRGYSVEVGGGHSSYADFTLPDPASVMEVIDDLSRDLGIAQPSPQPLRRSPRARRG